MLALVKKPHIELSIQGENPDQLIEWIQKKFNLHILTTEDSEFSPIEETKFWNEMQKNRKGNLLAGSRLKAGFTQAQLAKKLGIRQNMVSDYETGKRNLSIKMSERLSEILKISQNRLM